MSDPRDRIDSRTRCPACGYKLDAASHYKDPDLRPKPGDFSVCINCASILRFKGTPQLLTVDAEMRHVLFRHQAAVLAMHRSRRAQ